MARSKEVKAMGIPEGMPYYQLKEQYPNSGIVAFSSNYTLYGDMSSRIVSILREEAPDVIQYSIDESFLDLTGMDYRTLNEWGEQLCRKVLKYTGMPVSLGIASTNTLAKMASKYAKKYPAYNKCCVIGTEDQREKALKLFPVGDVWGIGRRIRANLEYIGVKTAYDFASLSKDYVRRKFHVTGERTWKELNGEPCIDIDGLDGVTKKTIVTSRSFPGMISDLSDLRSHVANYAARCALKLRNQKSVASVITVFIQSNHFREDLEQYDNSASYTFLTATNTTPEIVQKSIVILENIFIPGICYKRAGVMVSGISSSESIQPDLFTYNAENRKKLDSISNTIDIINRKKGADTIVLGVQQYRDKGEDGRSIKFVNAIKRALKSPDYTTRLGAFKV